MLLADCTPKDRKREASERHTQRLSQRRLDVEGRESIDDREEREARECAEIPGDDASGQVRGDAEDDRLDHQCGAQVQSCDGQPNREVDRVQRSHRIERVELAVEEHTFRTDEVGLRVAPWSDPSDREEPAATRLPILDQRGEICDDAERQRGWCSEGSEPVKKTGQRVGLAFPKRPPRPQEGESRHRGDGPVQRHREMRNEPADAIPHRFGVPGRNEEREDYERRDRNDQESLISRSRFSKSGIGPRRRVALPRDLCSAGHDRGSR
ncbi:MAG TPA: hypothetical protein VE549_17005 [Myxococcaceae bacterium]|nr:hypothetical protein [Myxococcaceae bacterium]